MKEVVAAVAVAALLAATAPIANAQTPPAPKSQDGQHQAANAPQPGQTLPKPVPRRPLPDTALVIGGLAGIAAVGLAVGGAGGGHSDRPSSP